MIRQEIVLNRISEVNDFRHSQIQWNLLGNQDICLKL